MNHTNRDNRDVCENGFHHVSQLLVILILQAFTLCSGQCLCKVQQYYKRKRLYCLQEIKKVVTTVTLLLRLCFYISCLALVDILSWHLCCVVNCFFTFSDCVEVLYSNYSKFKLIIWSANKSQVTLSAPFD